MRGARPRRFSLAQKWSFRITCPRRTRHRPITQGRQFRAELGAAIDGGTAIGEGQERVGVAQQVEECGSESSRVSGYGRAGGRAEAGRRW